MALLDFIGNNQSGLLNMAAALLAASGPSTRPTNFGSALGQGLLAFNHGQQQDQQRLEFERKQQERSALTDSRANLIGAIQAGVIDPNNPQQIARFMMDQPSETLQSQGFGLLTTPKDGFTLGPKDVRFNASGQVIARGSEAAGGIGQKPLRTFEDDKGMTFGVFQDSSAPNGFSVRHIPTTQGQSPTKLKTVQGVDAEGRPIISLVNVRTKDQINVGQKALKSLPRVAQDAISQGLDAMDALKLMEKNIKESGLIGGRISRLQAKAGFNKGAIDFETARANMKVAAQALIKGIPSNFDVQTVIDTLPDLILPESVNKSRLKFSKNLVIQLVKRVVAFHKGTGSKIPPFIVGEANKRGINLKSITPWDGRGDPLAGIQGASFKSIQGIQPATSQPRQRARNSQTGEIVEWDGTQWIKVQ